jgi:hypothetical protein
VCVVAGERRRREGREGKGRVKCGNVKQRIKIDGE